MKYIKKILTLIASVCMVLFLLYGPAKLEAAVDQDIYLSWLKGSRDEQWNGLIRVWVMYDGDDKIDGEWLAGVFRKYERKYPGIYVETQNFTPTETLMRLQEGVDGPDLYIFPETCPPQYTDIDIRFSMPLPEKEGVIESEFEFDILIPPELSPTPKPVKNFCAYISSPDSEVATQARLLAAFIADTALDMIQ